MSLNDPSVEYSINSIIGEGAEFKGEFTHPGILRIDGTFKGILKSKGKILIGKTGIVDTDIRAKEVIAGGIVNGNIYSSGTVTLLSTCKMTGDIFTTKLIIEEGASFDGNCKINPIEPELGF